jgi:hypothetical protein
MTVTDKILDRVKKLLALAESDNENEAAVAAGAAQRLLLEYNLTISDLSKVTKEDSSIEEKAIDVQGRLSAWRLTLCEGIVRAFGCRVLISKGYGKTSLLVVGAPNDVAVAQVTYEYLTDVVNKLTKRNARGGGRTYANSYRRGVVARLQERLEEQTKQNKEDLQKKATEAGIALVLRKQQNLSDYMRKFSGTYRSANASLDYGAYSSGYQDGDNVSLNRQVETSPKKRFRISMEF